MAAITYWRLPLWDHWKFTCAGSNQEDVPESMKEHGTRKISINAEVCGDLYKTTTCSGERIT
jgi:hypothetical protein